MKITVTLELPNGGALYGYSEIPDSVIYSVAGCEHDLEKFLAALNSAEVKEKVIRYLSVDNESCLEALLLKGTKINKSSIEIDRVLDIL
jgi:hypothetical protein